MHYLLHWCGYAEMLVCYSSPDTTCLSDPSSGLYVMFWLVFSHSRNSSCTDTEQNDTVAVYRHDLKSCPTILTPICKDYPTILWQKKCSLSNINCNICVCVCFKVMSLITRRKKSTNEAEKLPQKGKKNYKITSSKHKNLKRARIRARTNYFGS